MDKSHVFIRMSCDNDSHPGRAHYFKLISMEKCHQETDDGDIINMKPYGKDCRCLKALGMNKDVDVLTLVNCGNDSYIL